MSSFLYAIGLSLTSPPLLRISNPLFADTFTMRIFRFIQRFLPICLCCALCACKQTPPSSYSADLSVPPAVLDKKPTEQAPQEPQFSPFWDVSDVDISRVDNHKKLIAFTFDDAPTRSLENILAAFAAYNESNSDCVANATLFVNGYRFDRALLHTAIAAGFELGNHTFSHLDLTKLTKEELSKEIDETDALLCTVDGKTRHLLRAPFGKLNELVKECSCTPIIDWTIDTLDWTKIDETEIFQQVYAGLFDGALVLMHDGYGYTVSALKRLLPALKADGYQVVSVSQLIKAHGCLFENGKVYIRARKQPLQA